MCVCCFYFVVVKSNWICIFNMFHMSLLSWIFGWCKDVICWYACVLSGRVRRYVLNNLLCYIITHTLNFISPCYSLLRYANFCFITLTQFARYISYAYSWFDFDVCVLAVMYVLRVCSCYLVCKVLPHTVHCVVLIHCVCELVHFVTLTSVWLHYLSLC